MKNSIIIILTNIFNKINLIVFKSKVNSNKINGLKEYPEKISNSIFSLSCNFPNNTQLSIAIIQNEVVNYYGIITINDTIKPIKNQNKVFEIGSITKVFTSSVLATLVLEKKINLKDNINKYFSFKFNNDIKLNFQELANHTSGLPRLPRNLNLIEKKNPYKNYGSKALEEYLLKIVKLKDKKYLYSNLGAGLLGHTLGISQKKNFNELLQEKIFNKFKMNNSYTSLKGIENKLVKGLDKKGNEVPNWEFDVFFGGGGILSTTEDLVKFVKANFDSKNKELELTRFPTFEVNDKMKIGLGWHIFKSINNNNLFWHNGGTGGYSSQLLMDIEGKNAIIILSNVSEQKNKVEKLCLELKKIIEF
jgi:CubicO group peptidase (beta-lactamase class C family)